MNHNSAPDSCKRMIIVDDHILFREGLISLFRASTDFEVVGGAGSVYEAIMMARDLRPEIILMDFSMPDGTGVDATKAILAELPDCKIVFLSMYESDEKLFDALRAGAKGYMPKNTPSPELIVSLRALASGELALSVQKMRRVVEEFAHTQKPELAARSFSKLSAREMDVLRELGNDASNHEIAARLFLSENTVKHHIRSIFEKLQVSNRREAAWIARNWVASTNRPM